MTVSDAEEGYIRKIMDMGLPIIPYSIFNLVSSGENNPLTLQSYLDNARETESQEYYNSVMQNLNTMRAYFGLN